MIGEALEANRAPEDIYLSAHEADENLPAGTVISTLGVYDPDAADTHTYSLVDTEHFNAALAVDNAQLKAAVVFNYEAKDYYAFKLRCTDADGLYFDKPFLLRVRDVNDAPVAQNQRITTTINTRLTFTLEALDEDGHALLEVFGASGARDAGRRGNPMDLYAA